MLEDIKNELIYYGNLIWDRGLNSGVSGNLSARCQDKIVITATNTFKKDLKESDFVVLDLSGQILEGDKKPSCESRLHIEYYIQRDDVNAVFHVHSPYLSAFAIAGEPIDTPVLPDIVCAFDKIPLTDYAIPGSVELVEKNKEYFKNHNVILMKNHGVIVSGTSIRQAYINLEMCEDYAHKLLCAKILGGAKILSADDVKEIEVLRKTR